MSADHFEIHLQRFVYVLPLAMITAGVAGFIVASGQGWLGGVLPGNWQAAIKALIFVSDLGGPTTFAGIGIIRAQNRYGGCRH